MSTTDILFNSPALHSLKRAQLVQLCKKHNVKASGKNTELVTRLKEHAHGLPSSTPLSVAVRSENFDGEHVATDISDEDAIEDQLTSPDKHRESSPWEVISRVGSEERTLMDTKDVDNARVNDFGAAATSKPTILKSFASSIGLSRSSSANSNLSSGESSDSLISYTSKKDKEISKQLPLGSPKARSALSSLLSRSRSNSQESHSKKDARSSLIQHAIPYNEIPMPTTSRRPHVEPIAFSYAGAGDTSLVSDVSMASMDRPVPGIGTYYGINADDGIGTVRLITSTSKPSEEDDGPRLTPVIPSFDLVPPTPGNTGLHRFPISTTPNAIRTLYPTISSDDMNVDLDVLTSPSKSPSKGQGIDKSLPSLPPVSPTSPTEAFIFGSPNPRHSTAAADFSNAASSVLAEMNARLGAGGGRSLGVDVLANAPGSKLAVDELLKYEFGGARGKKKEGEGKDGKGEGSMSSKFGRAHEKVFSRMEGIDSYAAKRGMTEKGKDKEELVPLPDNRKRKQSAIVSTKNSAPATAKKSRESGVRDNTNETRKKTVGVSIPGAFEEEEIEVEQQISPADAVENFGEEDMEGHQRSAKRACVAELTADGMGETRRVSIAPKVRKDMSDGEEDMDDEKKRKQHEAIKRKLELNKARRRSSRGRPGTTPRTPGQKQKALRSGFLASAKSFVKSVWNRGGSSTDAKTQNSAGGPSYLRATAASANKSHEQDTKPALPAAPKPPAFRTPVTRTASMGSGGVKRKPSTSQTHSTSTSGPGSALETVAEGEKMSIEHTRQIQIDKHSGPILGSTQPRKSTVPGLTRNPSGSRAAATPTVIRSSRLLAPTASSLAKASASPTKAAATSGGNVNGQSQLVRGPGARARASVVSPSKIPVFSPPHTKSQGLARSSVVNRRIFGTPLMLPTSLQARSAAEKGQDVNPITGAVSPQRRLPFSSANGQTQSLMGAASSFAAKKEPKVDEPKEEQNKPEHVQTNKELNALRKPRISRSKVVARLGAHRERNAATLASPSAARSPAKTGADPGALRGGARSKGPATPKIRSSTAVTARRSLGGPAVRENGTGAVILSAKKRARATEYARRRSAKITAPDFMKGGSAMEVDD